MAATLFLVYSFAARILISKLEAQIKATGFVFLGFRSLTKTSHMKATEWNSDLNTQAEKEAEEEEEK